MQSVETCGWCHKNYIHLLYTAKTQLFVSKLFEAVAQYSGFGLQHWIFCCINLSVCPDLYLTEHILTDKCTCL